MDLNIRNVPESLMRLLKLEAAERSMTLRDNVILRLTGIPSKAELAGMGFDLPEDATVTGFEESVVEAKPDRHDIIIQALKDVCNGKRLSIPAEVGTMDKSRPAHDPTTCRVYKCGMCSKH
jgi:hypothetical protein